MNPGRSSKGTVRVVSQPEPSIAELFLENPVHFSQILNRGLLMLVDPTSKDADEELPWLEDLSHLGILGAISVCARLLTEATNG